MKTIIMIVVFSLFIGFWAIIGRGGAILIYVGLVILALASTVIGSMIQDAKFRRDNKDKFK